MVQLSTRLDQDLVRLRRRAFFYVDNSTDSQTRRIDAVLAGRHNYVVNFHFLETGHVTHFDYSDAEVRPSTNRSERAGFAELSDDSARAGFLIRNQHHLRRERTDADHAPHDSAARYHRHVNRDAGAAAAIDADRVEPHRRIAGDHSRGNRFDV